ncbi:hypothetical protein ACFV84_15785 [Kitasatospora sp. NPDC059811]|uniref:hypothetical protein n=1 Tax=Streptomycetaceae TaxID=2062 RepID=UPI000B0B5027|nr:hypothetical protein [Streptomyces sp. MJM8645]
MLGTGMHRGEILALHWSDVHLMDRRLYVRWTLAAVNNGRLHPGGPKTEASRTWISPFPGVMTPSRWGGEVHGRRGGRQRSDVV